MKYVAKKLAGMLITLLVVSFLVFAAFAVIPGDPATAMLGTEATPESVEALREQMGLNEPLLLRFGSWAVRFVQGDFGTSYRYSMPVRDMIAEKIPVTLTLTVLSFLMMTAVSIPLGIFCGHHAGGRADRTVLVIDQVIMSVPPFFSGILITLLFGLVLHLFTPGGYVSYTVSPLGFVGYLVFPSVAIALPKAAMAVKLLRTSVLSEMKLDYVRTAYSRGNRTKAVLYRHVLKNAMIPVVTFLGMALADMVAGSIVIEQVFNIPGLGRILLTSISNRDYPVVQAIIVFIAFLVIFTNFLVDLIYQRMDPRITLD
ncbi:MAG: ABC transporter permease [Eubacteriales bacterium]|nr:ABC transporter permease [Eubacteriales bacterium]